MSFENINIAPVSTEILDFESVSKNMDSAKAGEQLNTIFFDMFMKPMLESGMGVSNASSHIKNYQEFYLGILSQSFAEEFDIGFSRLQFNLESKGEK